MFAEFITQKLRKLDSYNRTLAQHRIHNVLFQIEVSQFRPSHDNNFISRSSSESHSSSPSPHTSSTKSPLSLRSLRCLTKGSISHLLHKIKMFPHLLLHTQIALHPISLNSLQCLQNDLISYLHHKVKMSLPLLPPIQSTLHLFLNFLHNQKIYQCTCHLQQVRAKIIICKHIFPTSNRRFMCTIYCT